MLVAAIDLFFHRLVDDPLHLARTFVRDVHEWRALGVEDSAECFDLRFSGEREFPRRHPVQQDPEGKQIAAVVHRLAPRLLGTHVGHGPEDLPRDRQLLADRVQRRVHLDVRAFRQLVRLHQLGQPEIEDLDLVVVGHQQVVGLQIAVDDPTLVRVVQCLGDG
jgi:hypothetical protein